MTDAPTTRETADHAELARLRQHIANLKCRPGHHAQFGTPSVVQVPNYWNRDLASDLEALLSEIAALRGERDGLMANYDRATRLHASTCRDLAQAERQRDDLRKALEEIADEAPYRSGYCQSDVEYGPALSADEMQAVARQALANQGAE